MVAARTTSPWSSVTCTETGAGASFTTHRTIANALSRVIDGMSDTDVARRQQGVAGPESRLCSSRELPVEGHVPAERVSQSNDHREESRNMDGIDERVPAYTGGEDGLGVLRGQCLRPQRELLEEPECRAQRLLHRRRAPVTSDSLPDLLAERVRRDRAV